MGVNAVFQFMRISVIGASLNCFTIFYLHYIVDKEFIVVVCDVLLITEYKWEIFSCRFLELECVCKKRQFVYFKFFSCKSPVNKEFLEQNSRCSMLVVLCKFPVVAWSYFWCKFLVWALLHFTFSQTKTLCTVNNFNNT